MTYNIGDLVVRYCFDKYKWDMVGIITSKRPHPEKKGESYHGILWFDPKKNKATATWLAHEFELIEVAKKLRKM